MKNNRDAVSLILSNALQQPNYNTESVGQLGGDV